MPCWCLRGACGSCGGVHITTASRLPPSPCCPSLASLAMRVAGCPVWMSLSLACWYAFPSCAAGPASSVRLPLWCAPLAGWMFVRSRPAISASLPPPPPCSVARELREGHLAGRWSGLLRWSVPSAFPARVPCSAGLVCVCGRGGGRSPVSGCLHSGGLQSSARAPGWLAGLILGLSCLTSLPGCSSFGRAVGVRCLLAVGAACKRGGPAVAPWLACTSEHSAPQCPQEDAWCGGGQAPLPQLRGVCGQALNLPQPPVLLACSRRPLA